VGGGNEKQIPVDSASLGRGPRGGKLQRKEQRKSSNSGKELTQQLGGRRKKEKVVSGEKKVAVRGESDW